MQKSSLWIHFLLLLALTAPAAAQSLGELTRKQKAQKREQAKPSRVYNTEDFIRDRPAGADKGDKGAAHKDHEPGSPITDRPVPFVPSPEIVVERMLQLARVGPGDVVYDLGCGDGRILTIAAQKFGAKAVGIELDPDIYKRAVERVQRLKLEEQVRVIQGDLLKADLSEATVVTLYLLPSMNERVRPNLEKFLRPGSRVVSHDFEVPGWTASSYEIVEERGGELRHTIYLYNR